MFSIFSLIAIFSFVSSTFVIGIQFTQSASDTIPRQGVPVTYSTAPSAALPLPSEVANDFQPANASFIPHINGSNGVISDCNGEVHGSPSQESCEDAFNQMSEGSTLLEFGDRTKGIHWGVPLPYRYISGASLL